LNWQKAQTGTAFIHAPWRALMRGFALLLLLTHQPWAGVICAFTYQDDSHAGCSAAQRKDITAEARQEVSDSHTSSHCASEEAPVPVAEFDNSPQNALACCSGAPQADALAVAVSSPKPMPVENAPPPIHTGAQKNPTPALTGAIHPQRRQRPIYLSLSCWLI
jgi:hypothetical protein